MAKKKSSKKKAAAKKRPTRKKRPTTNVDEADGVKVVIDCRQGEPVAVPWLIGFYETGKLPEERYVVVPNFEKTPEHDTSHIISSHSSLEEAPKSMNRPMQRAPIQTQQSVEQVKRDSWQSRLRST